MAVSALPALKDALIAAATAAITTATVYDGVGNSDAAGDYLMVGVDDPDGPDWARSASGVRDWEDVGLQGAINEEGDIACVALSWNGGSDPKVVRDAVYAIAEALAGTIRSSPTLGLPTVLWVLYGGQWDLQEIQDPTSGVLAKLTFQLHYRALV